MPDCDLAGGRTSGKKLRAKFTRKATNEDLPEFLLPQTTTDGLTALQSQQALRLGKREAATGSEQSQLRCLAQRRIKVFTNWEAA